MWNRGELKEKAKSILRGNYWKAFVVSLIMAIVGGGGSGSSSSMSRWNLDEGIGNIDPAVLAIIVSAAIFIGIFALAILLLVGNIIQVGGRKFYIQLSEGDVNVKYLTYGFEKGRYMPVFLTMLLSGVYIFLWTLLFIIPGLIKSYAYRMVPYILADNPHIGPKRAIELSNQMTQGQKWRIFVLDLSFIGWYILGIITLFIGVLFVQPYYDATNGELYLNLRKKALVDGITTNSELNITINPTEL